MSTTVPYRVLSRVSAPFTRGSKYRATILYPRFHTSGPAYKFRIEAILIKKMDALLMFILFRLFFESQKRSRRFRRIENTKQRILLLQRRISRRKLQHVIVILALLSRPTLTSPRNVWSVTR